MKVTLFEDMRAEQWYSMDRYADCIKKELGRGKVVEASTFCTEPPIISSRVRMFWRTQGNLP